MKSYLQLSSLLVLFLAACSRNDTCKKDYQGIFKVNMSYFTDSAIAEFVESRHWDTVSLISDSNGSYYFNTSDKTLKESEGYWFVESDNIEGECIGYIKQNNLKHPVPVGPFVITILDPIKFSIQFVKVE